MTSRKDHTAASTQYIGNAAAHETNRVRCLEAATRAAENGDTETEHMNRGLAERYRVRRDRAQREAVAKARNASLLRHCR